MHRKVHTKIKTIKHFLLTYLSQLLDERVWKEFISSQEEGEYGYFILYDFDLPCVRDLKAIMNMLTAIEKATESYIFMTLSVIRTMRLPLDIHAFYKNYKVYMSTTSALMRYMDFTKEYLLKIVLPNLALRLNEFLALCTAGNFEKAAEFFIDKIISLEQYRETYLQNKNQKPEIKKPQDEKFFYTLVKRGDSLLKKHYKQEYPLYFPDESKKEIDYSSETKVDDDTVKNIKRLRNGFISIAKFMDDSQEYSQRGLSSVTWIPTLIADVHSAYSSLQAFKYQEIMAEKSGPLAEYIKEQFKLLNSVLEKMACIVDEIEGEQCLKENTLLKYFNLLIERHNQITKELEIPTDYIAQKRIYYHARLRSREKQIEAIDVEIQDLKKFLPFRNDPFLFIPGDALKAIQDYFSKHQDVVISKDKLHKYMNYLTETRQTKGSTKTFIKGQFYRAFDKAGLTTHSEIMKSLYQRERSLTRLKYFLSLRLEELKNTYDANPYDHLKVSAGENSSRIVLTAFQEHIRHLGEEKLSLHKKAGLLTDGKEGKEEKKPAKVADRLIKKINFVTREHGLLDLVATEYEKTNNFTEIYERLTRVRTQLSAESTQLLHEMHFFLKQGEKKTESSSSSSSLSSEQKPPITEAEDKLSSVRHRRSFSLSGTQSSSL